MRHVFWWKGRENFGDKLATTLLSAMGIEHTWAEPALCDLMFMGSILQSAPPTWAGTIAGAGKLFEYVKLPAQARVLALRGALTAKGVKGDYALGDPGILSPYIVSMQPQVHKLGVVPHWSDYKLVHDHPEAHLIAPTGDPVDVITDIASCERIVSSSLHGIIIADAFGIPRQAEMFELAVKEGGDFKYRDYASAIGMKIEFGRTQVVGVGMASAQRSLLEAMDALAQETP